MPKTDNQQDIEIGERLKIIIEKIALMSVRKFSLSHGINDAQLGRIIKGKEGLSIRRATEISSTYNVRLDWLLNGDGPMLKNKTAKAEVPAVEKFVMVNQSDLENLRISLDKLLQGSQPVAEKQQGAQQASDRTIVRKELTGGQSRRPKVGGS